MKNFEKNIQKKADTFQLDPMPGSFDQVMKALEKKKKRRFIFWLWILIPGIALGATGLLIGQYVASTPTASIYKNFKSIYSTTNFTVDKGNKKDNLNTIGESSNEVIVASTGTLDNNIKTKHTPIINKQEHVTNNLGTIVLNNVDQQIFNFKKEEANIQTQNSLYNDIVSNKRELEALVMPLRNSVLYFPWMFNSSVDKSKELPFIKKRPVFDAPFSKWSLGVYTELGASQSVYTNNADSGGYSYTQNRQAADRFLLSYSAGIQFRYSPVKFITIETGIGFTHCESNQYIINGGFTTSSLMDQNSPDTVLTLFAVSSGAQEYHNIYDNISIPLKVYYQKKWKWTGVEAGAGVIFDIPVHTRSYVADEVSGLSVLRNDVKSSRQNNFGVQASINVHMVFHARKLSFFAGPVFKYRLNSMFDNNYIIRQNSYFIGGELGARYNF